nr:MAG TPA: hypothetical protein [Caudoviricetes sp.]
MVSLLSSIPPINCLNYKPTDKGPVERSSTRPNYDLFNNFMFSVNCSLLPLPCSRLSFSHLLHQLLSPSDDFVFLINRRVSANNLRPHFEQTFQLSAVSLSLNSSKFNYAWRAISGQIYCLKIVLI